MTVHLLSTPRVLAKLRTELQAALPDVSAPLSIRDIEQLPYLSAVITEGLRLAMGTSQRQTRISPTDVMTFNDGKKQWHIPPGVSRTTPLLSNLSHTHVLTPHPLDTSWHGRAACSPQPGHLCRSHGIPARALHREAATQALPDDVLTGVEAVSGHAAGVHGALFDALGDLAPVRQQGGSRGGWLVGVVRDGPERHGYGF